MTRSGFAVFAFMLLLALSGTSSGVVVELPGVPSYSWYEGCGPTAAGMILGYWDAYAAPNLIPQPKDSQAIRDMIASPEHFTDYVGWGVGVDGPLPHHADNSLADFMWGSRGPELADGNSYEDMQVVGLVNYAKMCGYAGASGWWEYYGSLWDDFVAEINARHPAEFFVASTGSGKPDHYVTAFGYDDNPSQRRYKAYNTDGGPAQWYDFAPLAAGKAWSIQSGTFFNVPEPEPAMLQWRGPFVGKTTWDVGITANWWGGTGDYCTFRDGDNVRFGDFLAPTATVNVSAVVKPGSVVVDNSMTNYEFTGAGSIDGPCNLTKIGEGTLVLSASNTYTGGTEVSGGTLLVENTAGSATGTGAVTVSAATLGGTGFIKGPVTLTGDATLTSTGTLTIDNTLTIQGLANQLAAGTVLTSGDVTIDPEAVFIINGTLGGDGGSLIVRGTLMGKGTINKSCIIEADGVLDPGSPSTIQGQAQILNAAAPRNFSFEIGAASPNYASPGNSVNDVIRLTDPATPFADASGAAPAALSADTVIDVYFLWSDPALGEYKAEFFAATDFSDAVAGATYQYWRLDPRGSRFHNGNLYSPLDESLVDWSVVPETADFGGANVSGFITEFTVAPEPATLALLTLGCAGLAAGRARKRSTSSATR
ncbi:MAG: autotransporter-associated beta strand repeat-containing protein [Planctomycetota bacterium]|nr:autotransporter-associated beta strand repeat-containing protein [Planctomycetota bacterium]